jgi:hypothetical protein
MNDNSIEISWPFLKPHHKKFIEISSYLRVDKHSFQFTYKSKDCALSLARSLETKWGIMKHDVSKFVGAYAYMCSLKCEW